ncbi:MAG: hypothetical protein RR502_06245, partial [Oscillospiraceae bacterium]
RPSASIVKKGCLPCSAGIPFFDDLENSPCAGCSIGMALAESGATVDILYDKNAKLVREGDNLLSGKRWEILENKPENNLQKSHK